ncbi:MAG: hybrid cluster-associated redox disulfide protein [Sulfitobacter sp.]|jgi:hybrid cluster-associated redox disulfide protein
MRQADFDDPDLPLQTLMSIWPETIAVFLRHRMLCVGCMVNPFHTVIDACLEYGLDEEMFRRELHQAIGA